MNLNHILFRFCSLQSSTCPLLASPIEFATSWTHYLEGSGGNQVSKRVDLQLGKHGINSFCLRSVGGLGFKKAKNFNSALLAKLAQMITSKRDSLCMRILRSKYKVKEDWLWAKAAKYTSPIWKAIEKARAIVSKGACYLIRDGKSVPKPQTPLKVSQLIDPDLQSWRATLILALFDPNYAKAILNIPRPSRPRLDKLLWIPNSKGCFSAKFSYKELSH